MMSNKSIIEHIRASMKEKLEARLAEQGRIDKVREVCLSEKRDPIDSEAAVVTDARAKRDALDKETGEQKARISELEDEDRRAKEAEDNLRAMDPGYFDRGTADVHLGQEPRTYTRETSKAGVSFFRDAIGSFLRGDPRAHERLSRHMTECEREGQVDQRAQTTGGSSGFIIPNYLVDQYASVIRSGRPLANAAQHLDLPASGLSIIIPKATTGSAVASQVTENSNVQNTDVVWGTPLTVPIVTVAGQQDLSRQLLERTGGEGIDVILYQDLAAAYAAELDRQVANGSGASNQMLGILNTAGTTQMSAFTAAATGATFMNKFSGAKAAVNTNRALPADVAVMHPNRWGWLESQVDGNGRPYIVPNTNGPQNSYGVYEGEGYGSIPGTLGTLPVITDTNVPTAVGTGPEDVVMVVRREDLWLWEDGSGAPNQLRFDQTLGGQLTSKLVVYGYAAFTAARYPQAVAKIGGNSAAGFGLIAPVW